jgi:hypothetical protein
VAPGEEPPADRGVKKFSIVMWTTILVLAVGTFFFARWVVHLVWP